MERFSLHRLALIAGLLLAADGRADVIPTDQFSLNFEKIRYEFRPATDTQPPFAIDISVDPKGQPRTVFRPTRSYNVTLKRGVIGDQVVPGLTELTFDLEATPSGAIGPESLGEFSTVITGEDAQTRPRVKLVKVGAGTLVLSGSNTAAVNTIELRFRPRAGSTLSGQPGQFFSRPRPDGELIARLPVPATGKSLSVTLSISDGRSALQLPVTIARVDAPLGE